MSVQSVSAQSVTLICCDGQPLAATYWPHPAARGGVVIAAALGVPQGFYQAYAAFLNSRGLAVLTFDYRGVGCSKHTLRPPRQLRYRDWGQQDIDAALRFLMDAWVGPIFLVGNSCGAQLFGLAEAAEHLSGVIMVAGQSAHWRLWKGPLRRRLRLLQGVVLPLLAAGPAFVSANRLGLGSLDLPTSVLQEWARYGREPDFIFSPRLGLDTHRYRSYSRPLLAYGFSDDALAPAAAIDDFLRHFPCAEIERRQCKPAELGMKAVGHVGFFRAGARETLWQESAQWIESIIGKMTVAAHGLSHWVGAA